MAGIGFELRKLFSERDKPFGDLKAIAYSTIVSVGPWIITSVSLNVIVFLGKLADISRYEKVLYTSTILYAFIFSQLLTGPFQYIVTRYVSDCVFSRNIQKIRGAYIGISKIILILAFFLSYFFIRGGELSSNYKMVTIVLFITMSLSWITMIFVSLLKNYNFMIKSFLIGNVVAIVCVYVFFKFPNLYMRESMSFIMVLGYTIGIFLNFLFNSIYLLKVFQGESREDFEFLGYFKGYFNLFFTGLFYFWGVWVHIIVNWYLGDSYITAKIFRIAPLYEIAVFYSFCTAIPSMVYFMIFLETRFLPVYQNYYKEVFYTGSYEKIKKALEEMYNALSEEIFYSMELQFIISITFILAGDLIFDYFGLDLYLLEVFRLTVLSVYCAVFVAIYITIFLYFDFRGYAALTGVIFFLTNIIFSVITSYLDSEYLGVGFFCSSFLTLIVAMYLNRRIFNSLTYITMFRRNYEVKIGEDFSRKVNKLMNKKIYILIVGAIMLLFGGCTSYDKLGFNNVTKRNWHTMGMYSQSGYDFDGYNSDGLDIYGFNRAGWNEYTDSAYDGRGFDKNHIHRVTGKEYDERGFNQVGLNIFTQSVYDKFGFDVEGKHEKTGTEYNEEGWTYYGLNEFTQDYYDKEGYNVDGVREDGFKRDGWNIYTNTLYDGRGFDIKGIHRVTGKEYDERGFNQVGLNVFTQSVYDKFGFDVEGKNRKTGTEYNEKGWTYYGLNRYTQDYYDREGYNVNGVDENGYRRGETPPEDVVAGEIEIESDGYDRDWIDDEGFNKDGIYIGGY